MKSKKSLLFIFAALLTSVAASAQWSVGIRSGVQWSNIHQTDLVDAVAPDFDNIQSFQVSAVGEYALSDLFALQSELGYVRKGFGYRQGTDVNLFDLPLPVGVKAEARFKYLEMPVLAKLKFGGRQMKAYVMAGPYLGYAVDGQLVTRTDGLIEVDLTNTDINLDAINYERFEIGGTVGAGVSYDAGFGTFFVDARYQHGFTGLYDLPLVDETVRNRGFGLSAGFALPLGMRP